MGSVMKVIAGCMSILGFFSIVSIITGNDFVSTALVDTYDLYQTINGTTTDISLTTDGTLALDPIQQAVIWIVVIGAIAVASGLTVVATGLNDTASHWLVYMIFFSSIWAMLSTLPYSMIMAIETYGGVIYMIITMIYAIASILWIGGAR